MRNLLLSTVTFLVVPAVAIAAPDFSSQSHTHTTPIELKPISSSSGLKLAGVCFLGAGDCGDGGFGSIDGDDGYIVDTIKQCQNEGYSVTACSLPSYTSGQCPYNDKYFAKCVEDRPRACNETGFTQTQCSSGMVVDTTCSYDANYKKCKCNPCSGYDYTYAQATAQGYVADGSCLSCSETKYKRKENPCSGYTTCECGGEIGSAVCYSGSTQKFKNCKTCESCPGYYECGGEWQYCEGTTCSADSSKCSTFCESDYFPNSCDSEENCNGIYRNGYCSGECKSPCAYTSIPENKACKGEPGCYTYCTKYYTGEYEQGTLRDACWSLGGGRCYRLETEELWHIEHCYVTPKAICKGSDGSRWNVTTEMEQEYGFETNINELESGREITIGEENCNARATALVDKVNAYLPELCQKLRDRDLAMYPYR